MASIIKLIADSGSTKTEWCLLTDGNPLIFHSQGMSPYFNDDEALAEIIRKEVLPQIKNNPVNEIAFYGTGCKSDVSKDRVRKVLQTAFSHASVFVENDLFGAARALCGLEPGIACILGTGSNSCYFDGNKIVHNSPGLGFVLGDEGSGAVLGKKVIQHYLYQIFDEELKEKFDKKYNLTAEDILEAVYRKPLPNRYLASFTLFLVENRGHYMIENIIEDGLNEFFFTHLIKYPQSTEYPVHFTGSVAYGFRDMLEGLCEGYGMELGTIYKTPMEGLIRFHTNNR